MTGLLIPDDTNLYQENFEDFFEMAVCGFIIADAKGQVLRANRKLAEWIGCSADAIKGQRFSELLSIGGKIYYETHLFPLLRMQGFFDEVVLELIVKDGLRFRVLVNAYERRTKDNQPLFIRFMILKASDRLQYEENLRQAKTMVEKELVSQTQLVALREQLIAVLGHDLRNPLASIISAVDILMASGNDNNDVLAILRRSSARMKELVDNIMDFARTRMGDGIVLSRRNVVLAPLLQQVVDEIKLIYPKREIIYLVEITAPVNCDPDRITQLISNLLSNAITHGDVASPIRLHAFVDNSNVTIAVINKGIPIPTDLYDQLFSPFTKDTTRPSQNGLGLGLYIASQIARAHNAILNFVSTEEATRFTFQMRL